MRSIGCRTVPLVALLVSGCTTSVSTLQTARTLDPGKVEFVAGGSVPIHGPFVSSFPDMIDSAGERVTTGNSTAMTPDEERRARGARRGAGHERSAHSACHGPGREILTLR